MKTLDRHEASAEPPWACPELQALEDKAERSVRDGTVWRQWGSGPAVVLLHGSAGSWTHWVRNIEWFAQSYAVHVPDLPGCGDSPALTGTLTGALTGAPTLGDIAQAMLPGCAAIAASAAPGRLHALIGFSFGSFLAEEMLIQCPTLAQRLVLVRGTFGDQLVPMPAGLRGWRKHVGDPEALRAVHRSNLQLLMLHDPARVDEMALELHARNQRQARLDVGLCLGTRRPDALARLPIDPYCMSGEFDALAGFDAAAQAIDLQQQRPGTRLHVVADAGHWAPYEQAQAFHRLLAPAMGLAC